MQRWLFGLGLTMMMGCKGGLPDVNLFSIDDDIELGGQLRDEINASPDLYNVLKPKDHPESYAHIERIRDEILNSGQVEYAEDFEWETYLIHDDSTLNAFAAPGGYIYVYTGLIRYLEEEDHLAGVMGHEIAHADRRHSTNQLSKAYGISVLLGVVFGEDPGLVPQIASTLASLGFSREDESEADEYSVIYLCETDYASDGAAAFFEKLESEGGASVPEFLSTHPNSGNRVEDIRAEAADRGCETELNPNGKYAQFLESLPPEYFPPTTTGSTSK